MPFSASRFNRLLALKEITQQQLADAVHVAQSQISDCRKGICRTNELTERIAQALDCTPDFLLGWSFKEIGDDEPLFRSAVAQMAYAAFAARINLSVEKRDWCRRVLHHTKAPLTADAWAILAEQIELAVNPTPPGDLRIVRGSGAA